MCNVLWHISLSFSINFIECSSKITQKLENICIFLFFNKTKCSLEISDFGKSLQYLQLLYHKFALYAQPLFFKYIFPSDFEIMSYEIARSRTKFHFLSNWRLGSGHYEMKNEIGKEVSSSAFPLIIPYFQITKTKA